MPTDLSPTKAPASATTGAGFNIAPGAAPTSPVDGDVWTTSAGIFVRINGVTVGPLSAGGGGGSSLIRTSVPFAGGEYNIAWLPPAAGGTFNITLYSDNSTAIQLSTAHINRDLQSGYVAVANSVPYANTTSITVPAGKTLYLSRTTQNAGGYIIIEQTA